MPDSYIDDTNSDFAVTPRDVNTGGARGNKNNPLGKNLYSTVLKYPLDLLDANGHYMIFNVYARTNDEKELPSTDLNVTNRALGTYNNSFTSYDTGSFESLYQLKYLDISNNELSSQALEQIIEDLYSNYTTTPRGGVTVNIKNSMTSGATLPETSLETIVLLRAKGWTVILQ